jgi:ribosomal protein L25 (general stress protein Ctc)
MADRILDIKLREKTGKEAAHKERQRGFIPAVLYGIKGNKILTVKAKDFEKMFEEIGEHSAFDH